MRGGSLRHASKGMLLFIAINMLLLILGLAIGSYAYLTAGRYVAQDIVFVAPFGGDAIYHFSVVDTEAIYTTPVGRGRLKISRGDRRVSTSVMFCEASYFELEFKNFIEGNPWHSSEKDTPVIILNEALAWYLFGGDNITGLTVEIENIFYRITGVIRQEGNEYMAWLPISKDMEVTAVYLKPYPFNRISARTAALELLQCRTRSDYAVVNVNRYIESIGVRQRILLYVVWLYLVLVLIKALKGFKKLIPLIIRVLVIISAYDILLWLPNLADPDVSLIAYLSNTGVMPIERYLSQGMERLSILNHYANFAWITGFVALLNLGFCLRMEDIL